MTTPRTDKLLDDITCDCDGQFWQDDADEDQVARIVEHARTLEIELAGLREKVEAETIERCAKEIPTSWLDPLLTGPENVVGIVPDCPMVERLFKALAKRIRALLPAPPAGKG